MDEAPAGSDAPAPVLSGVVVDTETAVKGPAGAEQPAVAPEQTATELQEPTVAVAHEPVVTEAQEPAVTEPVGGAQEPVMTEAGEPAITGSRDEHRSPS